MQLTKIKIVIQLKHLSNLWKSLDVSLINYEVSLTLTWSKNYVLTDLIKTAANPNANPTAVAIAPPTDATFKKTDTKLYVPVVALSAENDSKLSGKNKDRS